MFLKIGENLNDILGDVYTEVISNGAITSPRGKQVIEHKGPVSMELKVHSHPWTFIKGRRINPYFAIAEMVWILAGRNDVSFISFFNKNIANYSDDGKTFYGAYGERLRAWPIFYDAPDDSLGYYQKDVIDQIPLVVTRLRDDNHTRQAVMSLWDPSRDLKRGFKDYPCNNLCYFTLRDNVLHMSVIRRSNDMIWGLPYNQVQFYFLHALIAGSLEAQMGTYYEYVHNMHVYVREYPKTYQNIFKKIHSPNVTEDVAVPLVDRRISLDSLEEFVHFYFMDLEQMILELKDIKLEEVRSRSSHMRRLGIPRYWAEDIYQISVAYVARKRKNMNLHNELVKDIEPGLAWLIKDFNQEGDKNAE